jgi:hypothetical protein
MDPDPAPDPDPALFISDSVDANKKYFFPIVFIAYFFFKVHLHHSSKIKSHKEVTKQYKSRSFLLFLLDNGRIRIREVKKNIRILINTLAQRSDP